MIVGYLSELGVWNWLILGLLLLILELLAPGIFFIWFALAALFTGGIALLFNASIFFGWQMQTVLFLTLAVLFLLLGRRFFASGEKEADEPLLNRRGDQLVGQRTTLNEAIVNGHGRVKLNDTIWRATGPDLPIGTQVIIVAFNQGTVIVEPVILS